MTATPYERDIELRLVNALADTARDNVPESVSIPPAPSLTPQQPHGSPRRSFSAWAFPLTVAALLVLAFAVTPLILHLRHSGSTATSATGVSPLRMSDGPRLEVPYTLYPVAGYAYGRQTVTKNGQTASVFDTADAHASPPQANPSSGVLYTWSGASFDPASVMSATTVTVDGGAASYGLARNLGSTLVPRTAVPGHPDELSEPQTDDSLHPTLAWQDPAGNWYALQWNVNKPALQQIMTRIANALRPGLSPLRTPFAVASLPTAIDSRASMSSAIAQDDSRADQATVAFTSTSDATTSLSVNWIPSTVSVEHLRTEYGAAVISTLNLDTGQAVLIKYPSGQPTLLVPFGKRGLISIAGGGQAANPSALVAVANGVSLSSDPMSPPTWFPATQAMPH
jgi:hypothetical protein